MPSTNGAPLAEPLSRWWRNVAGPQLARSVYFWTGPGGQHELVHRLLAEDAGIQALQLINFFGTPQGQLIADAVTQAMIPEPWATFVREGLTILAERQRDVRHQQIGQGVGITVISTLVGVFLYALLSGSGPAPAAAAA